jgi:hypothetical protein
MPQNQFAISSGGATMREEHESMETSPGHPSEAARSDEAEQPGVALRNDEISKADFDELCRLAELALDRKS